MSPLRSWLVFACGALLLLVFASFAGGALAEPAPNQPRPALTQTPTTIPVTPTPTGVPVAIQNFAYAPASLTVPLNQPVTWTNNDSAPHDVAASGGSWASPTLSQGQQFTRNFDQPGTYDYICSIHPFMRGSVTVVVQIFLPLVQAP
ncbi:MAG: cupredoxin family copper-binding protein [Chloroflexaceae bacterium]|jgi:plastocyanin|nr:cupredoxin family copper-binding protein [Chloroflexaceae bacterium]